MWLFSHGRSKKYDVAESSKSGISTQRWTELANRFDELIEWGIVEKSPSEDVKNIIMYSLTIRGQELANMIIDLEGKFPELWNFESFKGVKRID